jgi:hypothetical protein
VLYVPRAKAGEWNQATKLTFSAPVEVPGRVLMPGTYWFTVMNDEANRNVVQIWTADRTHLVTTVLAEDDYRPQPTGKTDVKFKERSPNGPEAIAAWYYPGDSWGHEFVYPETPAYEMAKHLGLTTRPKQYESASNSTKPPAPSPQPVVTAMNSAPANSGTAGSEMAENTHTEPMETSGAAGGKELPKTASLLPLWGLMGLLSLGASFVLRGLSRHKLFSACIRKFPWV